MLGFMLLLGISHTAAIGFCAAGFSVANMDLPERTPEEIRKDSIKGVIYSLIAIVFAHLSGALIVSQKAEGNVGILVKTVPIFAGLLTIVCIARIVTASVCLWMYKELGKEPENGKQEKKQ